MSYELIAYYKDKTERRLLFDSEGEMIKTAEFIQELFEDSLCGIESQSNGFVIERRDYRND